MIGASLFITAALIVLPLAPASGRPGTSPDQTGYPHRYLLDVDVIATSDVWAVGRAQLYDGSIRSYTEHFDGSHWRHIATPKAFVFLQGVSAAGSDDVWAVGVREEGDTQPYALHWNGDAWVSVSTADTGGSASFEAVDVGGPDDVWAVGSSSTGSSSQALAQHWDGSTWRVVRTPVVAGAVSTTLSDVDAVAPNDVWAVGSSYGGAGQGVDATIMHWNGHRWSVVPSHAGSHAELGAVSVAAPGDVWAVGSRGIDKGDSFTVIEHWDGSRWSVVDSPNGPGPESRLLGVAAVAPDDVWAVGAARLPHKVGPARQSQVPLFEHWDGSGWSIVNRSSRERYSSLSAVSAVSSSDIWSVGGKQTSTSFQDLKLHWNGRRWR